MDAYQKLHYHPLKSNPLQIRGLQMEVDHVTHRKGAYTGAQCIHSQFFRHVHREKISFVIQFILFRQIRYVALLTFLEGFVIRKIGNRFVNEYIC